LENFGGYDFAVENSEVRAQYRSVINTRIGLEYMVLRDVFLRGGYALLPQPFKSSIGNVSKPNQIVSAGVGWKVKNLNVDVAYRIANLNYDYYAFDPSQLENRTSFTSWMHHLLISLTATF
jgi:long-subunit fatty acid transport protein